MTNRAPDGLILTMLKSWCLLLISAIAAQALVPSPEARAGGSPLNPSTIEVSLGDPRRHPPIRAAVVRRDGDDAEIPPAAAYKCPDPAVLHSRRPWHHATTVEGAYANPRAPPLA